MRTRDRASRDRTSAAELIGAGSPARLRCGDLVVVEIAEAAQQIVHLVGVARPAVLGELLQLGLDLGEHVGIEQIAQLAAADQLAQADCGRASAPAPCARRAARRPRRGTRRRSRTPASARTATRASVSTAARRGSSRARDLAQQLEQRRQIEHVAQELAIGLERDRERREPQRHRHQLLRAQALRPQRRALARAPARQEQRARGVLAEVAREHARARQLVDEQRLDLVGIGDQLRRPSGSASPSAKRSAMPSSVHSGWTG